MEKTANRPLILDLHDQHTRAFKELQQSELELVVGGEFSDVVRVPDVTVTSRESCND